MSNNLEILTVDQLLDNLPIYKDLIHHINALDSNIKVKIGAAYLRVSTDMQTEFSPEAQLEDIIKYCIQNNIMIPKENIFLEAGISGTRADKRPAFQNMVIKAESKEKPIDIILVHKFDRFARNREDSIIYKSRLRKKYGVEIVAVKEILPEDKKLAMMVESNLETWGEFYSMNLSDEAKKGQRKKADRGEHSGRPPLGYEKIVKEIRRDKNGEKIIREMIIKEDEAKIVKMIFQKFVDGESQMNITRYLNSIGIKTKNNGKFSDRAVNWILNNPVYIGYNRWTEGGMQRNWHNPDTISKKCDFPAIIDDDLWERTQKKLNDMNKIYGNKRKKTVKHEHWLRGLIRCDSCGELIVKNSDSFQCTGYTHGRCNISHSIKVKYVENAILEQIKNDFENKPINIEISSTAFSNDSEINILTTQLEQIELKEKRIKIAYENGVDTIEEYKENKERLQLEKQKLSEKLQELSATKDIEIVRNKIFKKCKDAYDILTDDEISDFDKSLITHQLFEKIIFKKSEHKLVIYYK